MDPSLQEITVKNSQWSTRTCPSIVAAWRNTTLCPIQASRPSKRNGTRPAVLLKGQHHNRVSAERHRSKCRPPYNSPPKKTMVTTKHNVDSQAQDRSSGHGFVDHLGKPTLYAHSFQRLDEPEGRRIHTPIQNRTCGPK